MVSCSASQQFRGDAEGLVDRLIDASHIQPVARSAKPEWFGRQLEKWCEGGHRTTCVPLEPLEPISRRAPDAGRVPRGKCQSRGPSPRTDSYKGSARRSAEYANFACPALAITPKPSDIPLPKTLLRGRSPSPPKDAFMSSYQVQQFVHPVAA